MAERQRQLGREDFLKSCELPDGAVEINRRVWFQDRYGMRAVFVEQTPFYTYSLQDSVEHRFCAAQLVEAGLASGQEVCAGFQISPRTFARIRNRLRRGGISALVPATPGPTARHQRTRALTQTIVRLYQDQRKGTCEIAATLGLGRATVRRVLRDEGIPLRGASDDRSRSLLADNSPEIGSEDVCAVAVAEVVETLLAVPAALDTVNVPGEDGGNSQPMSGENAPVTARNATASAGDEEAYSEPLMLVEEASLAEPAVESAAPPAERVEATSIPYAPPLDQLATVMGWIEEAPVEYSSTASVPQAGSLLGLALLDDTHLVSEARAVYGRLKNGWYGLRSLLWTLVVMGLLRIKRPEQLKLHDPASLGCVLGLPRAAEVKTIRRKLKEIAGRGLAAEWHRRLAKRRAEQHASELATLYVDGHVRVYHGKRRIGKAYVTRLKSVQRGETDYWVHLSSRQPLVVIHDPTNGAFRKVLVKQVLPEIRRLVGNRRVRVVFDRAGWSRELFEELLKLQFDFLTYRKGSYEPVEESKFRRVTIESEGRRVSYELAEEVFQESGWPRLRLIAVKKKDGGQTHILATGRLTWEARGQSAADLVDYVDPTSPDLAWWMFGRWSQENWFKYMDAEYALDVLVDYDADLDDAEREVPNPQWRKLDRQVRAARQKLQREEAKYARWRLAIETPTTTPPGGDTDASGEILPARLRQQKQVVQQCQKEWQRLNEQRSTTPRQIRLGDVAERDAVKLSYERKLFTDTIKLTAYEIETRLHKMLPREFRRQDVEGRSLIRDMLQGPGDLCLRGDLLEVHLEQLSAPRYTVALQSLCEQVNALSPKLPETSLHLRFFVKPRPVGG